MQIEFMCISNSNNEDIYFWSKNNLSINKYILDLIAIKSIIKTENIFYQINRTQLKICGIKKNDLIFIIAGSTDLQFQLLEALIEEFIENFFVNYNDIYKSFSAGFNDPLNILNKTLLNIINNIKDYVKFSRVSCKACKKDLEIFIKKSLIEKSQKFPVSLVYIHEGHGLLLFIDKNFVVRGAEIVDISG